MIEVQFSFSKRLMDVIRVSVLSELPQLDPMEVWWAYLVYIRLSEAECPEGEYEFEIPECEPLFYLKVQLLKQLSKLEKALEPEIKAVIKSIKRDVASGTSNEYMKMEYRKQIDRWMRKQTGEPEYDLPKISDDILRKIKTQLENN